MKIAFGIFGGVLFLLTILWSVGLIWFVSVVPRTVNDPVSQTEAIVVPTGGYGRLLAGLELLRAGQADQLFISGAYSGVTLLDLLGENLEDQPDCCIEIGHNAEDTYQNAGETAAWMAAHGFQSLRLVTGNYHMPRAILEFRRAMPDVKLVENPIFSQHVKVDDWWRYRGTAGLLASEYVKYLLALIRMPFTRASFRGNPP